MTSVKTLPLLEGAKLIVLDEGVEAMYSRKLIAGWIQMWTEKNLNNKFDVLLFSGPKSSYQNEFEPSILSNVNICDYYTTDVNIVDFTATQKKDFDTLEHILKTKKEKATVIIDCLSSLIMLIGLSKALWFLERLSKQVPQLICIYRRNFSESKVPCIETLGTTYVKIGKYTGAQMYTNFYYTVEFMHCKLGGTIMKQRELVTQNCTSYEIQSEKIERQSKKLEVTQETQKPKVESSFRLEINENEMRQREETMLPYVLNAITTNTSKIIYQPEDVDDIDEEDPDDDLCF